MESINSKNYESEFKDEVILIFNEIIKKSEIAEALNLLEYLPNNLFYHNKDHTLDVIKETILFAVADCATRDVIEQEAIAAAWHDVGYIKQSKNHESIGVEIFKKSETYKNMSEKQSTEIISNILDTEIVIDNNEPQLLKKRSKHAYVLDADVSNFGRKDYFEKGKMVAREAGLDLSKKEDKKKFLLFAYKLLKNHDWKTESARKLRQEQKEINMKILEKEIEKI